MARTAASASSRLLIRGMMMPSGPVSRIRLIIVLSFQGTRTTVVMSEPLVAWSIVSTESTDIEVCSVSNHSQSSPMWAINSATTGLLRVTVAPMHTLPATRSRFSLLGARLPAASMGPPGERWSGKATGRLLQERRRAAALRPGVAAVEHIEEALADRGIGGRLGQVALRPAGEVLHVGPPAIG